MCQIIWYVGTRSIIPFWFAYLCIFCQLYIGVKRSTLARLRYCLHRLVDLSGGRTGTAQTARKQSVRSPWIKPLLGRSSSRHYPKESLWLFLVGMCTEKVRAPTISTLQNRQAVQKAGYFISNILHVYFFFFSFLYFAKPVSVVDFVSFCIMSNYTIFCSVVNL